ncbi:response regulator transcription factor [Anaerosacchariphilus polymeriproducens]|uniref:Stage 0 sporulation protein A homolog n=1 Tax=Anaerosacchariphilus polymeriproducens TaxID=1812858 RepID=A0A371AX29_9FIRM|nr:helix-turn-helix domain-containing protein [Anaerosacchariphilus polymeriproducens]RDU24099.1 response regulator [Anaerosacchariphilus polymeriproducens]
MYKVLIADDEVNICMLIKKLMNWEVLQLEVIDIVHNAVDAFACIKKQQPDIVISDIRMPGYDGLVLIQKSLELPKRPEFIIISGYKYFEYAHRALSMGVEHYLLKPIDKEELEKSLKRIVEKIESFKQKEFVEKQLKEEIYTRRKTMKKHFLTSIIKYDGQAVDELKEEYQNNFNSGCFQAIFAKVDFPIQGIGELNGLLPMIEAVIDGILKTSGYEYINNTMKSGIVSVINFDISEKKHVEEMYNRFQDQLMYEMNKFHLFSITIGVGETVSSISSVKTTVNGAIEAVKCRIKKGVNRIIYNEQLAYNKVYIRDILNESEKLKIENFMEIMDFSALHTFMEEKIILLRQTPFYSPVSVFDFFETIEHQIVKALIKINADEKLIERIQQQFEAAMDMCLKEESLNRKCQSIISDCIDQLIQDKKNKSQLPVRIAKQYIQENYKKQLMLEDVAEATNLSPAYLSTIFKKELGISFTDYMISCRIEMAKELLKTTDESIAVIAEQVGYVDYRYFSKIFLKVVGLKPSVYRKLFM